MAISLKHSFTNPKADGGDTTIVRPSDWNAEHTLTQATNTMLGRITGGTGATEELTPANVRTFVGYGDPPSDDGDSLGTTSAKWSDLFLASGAVINFDSGDVTITHTANAVSMTGGYWNVINNNAAGTPPIYSQNTTDNAFVKTLELRGARATPATNDAAYISLMLNNSTSATTEFARIKWLATDITSTSEDAWLYFGVTTAGTLSDELILSGTALFPQANDGLALGTTTLSFSDLYLASGGTINIGNSGVVISASSSDNFLNFVGASVGFQYDNSGGFGSTIYSSYTEDVATGIPLTLSHVRSGTATNNDTGQISLRLKDSAGNTDTFARIQWRGTTVTSGSEQGQIAFGAMHEGTLGTVASIAPTSMYYYPDANPSADWTIPAVAYCIQTTDRTLTSTTSNQPVFDQTTNGTLNLPVGIYFFDFLYYLTSMSATNGNCALDFLGAGTAVINRCTMVAQGWENTIGTVSTMSGSGTNSTAMTISAPVVSSSTNTNLTVSGKGFFRVGTAGTIIPSIALTTAAAAIVEAYSYFKIEKVGITESTRGQWT